MFELNLYGIEIKARGDKDVRTMVWIEPLWNWNPNTKQEIGVRPAVWIEPLWNWNTDAYVSFIVASMFELNLYGIEILGFDTKPMAHDCLNWTFMELKCIKAAWEAASIGCLNWTFMELK